MAMETWSPLQGPSYGGFGPNPSLKPPGEGWSITGYKSLRVQTSNPKMGSGMKTIQIPIYTRQTQAAPPPPPPAPAPAPAPAKKNPKTLPTTPYTPPAGPTMKDVASQFSSQIADMQRGFQERLAQQASQFAEMQKAQEERMLTLQEQMKQSAAAAAAAARPTVAGVKTATGSAGTDMQIARRGIQGAFGRAGMRIQSLNV